MNTYTKEDRKRVKEIKEEIHFLLHRSLPRCFTNYCSGRPRLQKESQDNFKILMNRYIELRDEQYKLEDKKWAWQKSDKNKGGVQNDNR